MKTNDIKLDIWDGREVAVDEIATVISNWKADSISVIGDPIMAIPYVFIAKDNFPAYVTDQLDILIEDIHSLVTDFLNEKGGLNYNG